MIVNNRQLTEIDDELIFKTVPMYGLTSISAYSDSTSTTNPSKTFEKTFCYSFDGIVFTDWIALSSSNLANEINSKLNPKSELVLKFKYRRVGTDASGYLQFNSLSLTATYTQTNTNFQLSKRTIFKDLVYDNIDVYNLMINLTQKLYETGVVPDYMERAENANDIDADEDYILFWSTVSKFFAMVLIFAMRFKNVYWRRDLLSNYLEQKGIFFNNDDDLITLQRISQNFFDEIRQRGTFEVFRPAGWEYPSGSRLGYKLPDNYVISPQSPLEIDGTLCGYPEDLPFGWTLDLDNGLLIAPDDNFHLIRYGDIDSGGVAVPGDMDASYNIDFLIDLIIADNTVPIPANAQSGIKRLYHGEYLRLINFNAKKDEFMYNQANIKDFGWNLGNSSPMFKGLAGHLNKYIVKGYEPTADFIDLDNYPILG